MLLVTHSNRQLYNYVQNPIQKCAIIIFFLAHRRFKIQLTGSLGRRKLCLNIIPCVPVEYNTFKKLIWHIEKHFTIYKHSSWVYKRAGKLNYLNEKRAEKWEQKSAELKWAKVEAICIKYEEWGRKRNSHWNIHVLKTHFKYIHINPSFSLLSGHDLILG